MKTLVLLGVLTASSAMAQDRDGGPSPVPEPATFALLGAGLIGVGFAAWRKNRKK